MKMLAKILKSINEGSIKDKTIRKGLEYLIKNSNTRNKLLEDIALEDIRKKYSFKLEQLIKSYENEKMEYSNKVWVFWRQGYENAPMLVKSCFDSVKRNLSDRDIVFLSEDNIDEYVKIPVYIKQKRQGGGNSRSIVF